MKLQKCETCPALISLRGKRCRPCQDLRREEDARNRYYRIRERNKSDRQIQA